MRRPKAEFVLEADNRTARAFKEVEGQLQALAPAARRAALGASALAASVAAGTIAAARHADEIGKTARAAALSAERYQELQFAAEEAGVAQGQFDAAVVRFTKRLGLADQGAGAAVKAYERYGIATREVNGELRTSEAVMRDVADVIAGLGSEAERTAATTQFFGDDAARMRLLLEGGSDAIDRQARVARELGVVLDADVIRRAETANDQFGRMQKIINTQLTAGFASLFPVVVGAGNAFAAASPKVAEFFQRFDEGSEGRLQDRLEIAQKQMEQLRKSIETRTDFGQEARGQTSRFRVLGFQDGQGRELTADEMEERLQKYREIEEVARNISARIAERRASLIDTEGLIPDAPDFASIPGIGVPDVAVERAQEMFDRLHEVRLSAESRVVELEQFRLARELENIESRRQLLVDEQTITADLEAQFRQAKEDATAASEARITEIRRRENATRVKDDNKAEQARMASARRGQAAIVGSLNALAQESKGVRIAMLAVEKAKGIADITVLTQVAATRALAELGPVLGPPAAAAIKAAGIASAGIVAAQGLSQAQGGGGGAVSLPGPSAAPQDRAVRLPTVAETVREQDTNAAASEIHLHVEGSIISADEEETARRFGGVLREMVSEGDFVLIPRDSRQAIEIRGV